MDKTKLEKELLKAVMFGTSEDMELVASKVRELKGNFMWVAVYSDVFWSNNPTWIETARRDGMVASEVRIGLCEELITSGTIPTP